MEQGSSWTLYCPKMCEYLRTKGGTVDNECQGEGEERRKGGGENVEKVRVE
jgi:hypothetical protein